MNEKIADTQKLFQNAMTDVFGRFTHALEELAKLETKSAEQGRSMLDECARLAKSQLEYGLKLSADFREMALDAMRKATVAAQPVVKEA